MTTSEQRTRRPVRLQPGRDAQFELPVPPPPRRHRARGFAAGPPVPERAPEPTGALPPFGLVVSRPLLLLVAALVGATCGFLFTGQSGYKAQAVLEFTAPSADSLVVKQTGQTLARRLVSADILAAAESGAQAPAGSLLGRVSTGWEQDTNLVSVTVEADTEEAAIAEANGIGEAVVATTESQIRAQLEQAHSDSSELLDAEGLPSQSAEDARQAQVGQSLANRQDAIAARSGSVVLIDPAAVATHAGLTPLMGALIGLVAGLLLGGLAALLLGVRGLRVSGRKAVHTLFPSYRVADAGEGAKLAGQIMEAGHSCVAVVCPAGTRDLGLTLADELATFSRAHGRTVKNVGLVADRGMALATLGRDVRDDVETALGADLLIAVVEAGSDAAHLLEGQSDFTAVVMARRRGTTVAAVNAAMTAFDRATPTLVLAR